MRKRSTSICVGDPAVKCASVDTSTATSPRRRSAGTNGAKHLRRSRGIMSAYPLIDDTEELLISIAGSPAESGSHCVAGRFS